MAITELGNALQREDTALVLIFCSPDYDRATLGQAIAARFAGIPVVGCTTAGEIGGQGYSDGGMVGLSFSRHDFDIAIGFLDGLSTFEMRRGQGLGKALQSELLAQAPDADRHNSFGLLFIDGLSIREEQVTRALQMGLGEIPLIGGSAGDDLALQNTFVFHDGIFHTDSAACVVMHTALPFRIFKTQHFMAMDERLVVTEADSSHRLVKEINGRPAAEEYARILDTSGIGLDSSHFAASPVVVMLDGTNYVRSIQRANPDGSLTFYCAIEEGLVFRVAKGVDLMDNLEHALEAVTSAIGPPQAMLVYDCILRKLEISQLNLRSEVAALFSRHRAVGFNTYGEQYQGVHVNQTLVGIAFGEAAA
ncbi:FIST domain containing protein [Rhizobium sp. KAs_5_22]|uniref:FIST N-terminal domain-containing protein n=1 Tax=Ciceribacter selenitireducens TaxID=448181 RepID=UPI0004B9D3A0|nr:FIST N-terminal domain-containing protein [Ciceribacter selenitireducens]PPJ48885.1 FIST domain containing protein [Rhizobium sp. KAs_5_22]